MSKTIVIEDDGKNPTLEITTVEDGNTTIETLEGEAAQEFIEKEQSMSHGSDAIVSMHVTRSDLDNLERELKNITLEIEEVMNDIDVDSIMNDVEIRLNESTKCVKKKCVKTI
ncbi:MAG: hypothetical protein Salg2KO_11820 [Salibacteraceae bacterium]